MKITYIAFLRGINVGGHRVKMQHLKKMFEHLGLENVRTYIQSGNVSFDAPKINRKLLQNKIEKQLLQELGYQVPTFLRTIAELENSLHAAPFKNMETTPKTRYFIMFTSGQLPKNLHLPMYSQKKDFTVVGIEGEDMFVVLDLNVGKPGNPALFVEKTFKVTTTSRFYHTLVKILESAKS